MMGSIRAHNKLLWKQLWSESVDKHHSQEEELRKPCTCPSPLEDQEAEDLDELFSSLLHEAKVYQTKKEKKQRTQTIKVGAVRS